MFFTQISQLMTQGVDLTIVIRRKENELIVSTLPKSNTLKDEAQHHIVPLTLAGTPAEIDAGFLQAIAQPIGRATGLIVNLEQFEQQAAKASANSKAAKDAQAKESKEEKEKREKCERFMKKADELIAVQKFDEALVNLQQARLSAVGTTIKTVDEKITEVKTKLSQGSLFTMDEMPSVQPQQPQMHVATAPVQQQSPVTYPPRQVMQQQQTTPQQQVPQTAVVQATPTMKFEDEYRYPAAAVQTFDPAYCRPDEYEAYPDFPVNMNAPMYNHPQIF